MAATSLLSAGRCTHVKPSSVCRSWNRLCSSGVPTPAWLRHHPGVDQAAKLQLNRPSCQATSNSGRHQRRRTAVHATLQGGLVAEPQSTGGARELLTWISELPWPRVAIWLTVALTASQFHDFFGVSFFSNATFIHYLEHWCTSMQPSATQQMDLQIVMGTFIVAFIGNGFVSSTQKSTALRFLNNRPMLRRRLLVLMYFSGIVSVVFLFGVMTIPDIIREGADFVRRLKSENVWVVVLEKMRNGLGYGFRLRCSMYTRICSKNTECTTCLLSMPLA